MRGCCTQHNHGFTTTPVLQAVAHHAHGEADKAVQLLGEALALAEPGGFIRLFVDEGVRMAQLLSAVAAQGLLPGAVSTLLAAFQAEAQPREDPSYPPPPLTPQSLSH